MPELVPEECHHWGGRYCNKDPEDCSNSCLKATKGCNADLFLNTYILLLGWWRVPFLQQDTSVREAPKVSQDVFTLMWSAVWDRNVCLLLHSCTYTYYDVSVEIWKTNNYFADAAQGNFNWKFVVWIIRLLALDVRWLTWINDCQWYCKLTWLKLIIIEISLYFQCVFFNCLYNN